VLFLALWLRLFLTLGVSSAEPAVTTVCFARFVPEASMIAGCSPRYSRVKTRDHDSSASAEGI
jgi:hypothetical protein